ncbi:hypothetical protein P886_1266 [Alteromonadaceae bacterium 2753L.S.0a.02]|nr:hypothetical protein P886_1266 [Alteromonadaceae bacterium 2753L.S.0a.02]
MKNIVKTLLFGATVFVALDSTALEEIRGKIKVLEPTYLPASIRFHMDSGSPSCPAGHALDYSKSDTDNNLAVYSTLLAAFVGDQTVRIYIEDGDTTCMGKYVHILK